MFLKNEVHNFGRENKLNNALFFVIAKVKRTVTFDLPGFIGKKYGNMFQLP